MCIHVIYIYTYIYIYIYIYKDIYIYIFFSMLVKDNFLLYKLSNQNI